MNLFIYLKFLNEFLLKRNICRNQIYEESLVVSAKEHMISKKKLGHNIKFNWVQAS